MKNVKNYLLSFILGGIVFSGITVFAEYVVTADKIEYANNVSVKDKIDDLYTKVKPVYTGETTITPTTSEQTLYTSDKILKSNVTINKIPSNYKNINDTTNFTASDLKLGEKAYNSSGKLIIGTYTVGTLNMDLITDDGAYGKAHIGISGLKKFYEKFKITGLSTTTNVSNCSISAYSQQKQVNETLSLNTMYYVSSATDGNNYTYIVASTNNGIRCYYTIQFYN